MYLSLAEFTSNLSVESELNESSLLQNFRRVISKGPCRRRVLEHKHLNTFVSICVQTYQHAPFIRQCLDGILMQEVDFEFEILLGRR